MEKDAELGELVLRQLMRPRDTNHVGSIFGGLLMSLADVAGSVPAMRHAGKIVVTRHVAAFDFKYPVFLGDLVSFYAKLVRVGNTSLIVRVTIRVERLKNREVIDAAQTEIVYVAIDEKGKPVRVPPLPPSA